MVLTSDVDNDVGVGELGQRLRNDSLSTTESTRNADGTTLNRGKQRVQDTLTDNKRLVGGQLLVGRTRHSHRPAVHHAVLSLVAIELNLQDLLVDGVFTLLGDAGNRSACAGRKKDLVLAEQRVLEDGTEDVTTGDVVANLEVARCKCPLLLTVEGGQVDTTGNVDRVRGVGDTLQRTLNTIVDSLHKTRAELDGERLSRTNDGVADGDTSCVLSVHTPIELPCAWHTSLFVDLNGGLVVLNSNNLSYKVVVTDTDLRSLAYAFRARCKATYKFVHGNADHVLGDNDGTNAISGRRMRARR